MRETRSQTKKRAAIRKKVIDKIKSKTTGSTAAMAGNIQSTHDHDLDEEFEPTGIFPLLSLPLELQRIVYKYAVAELDKVIMLENAKTPALARVNRYLRRNVVPIYLEVNTFRVFTEEAPDTENSQPREAKFKIHTSVLEWLDPLGVDTPLFKSLIIHFGAENEAELVLQYARKASGFTVTHEHACSYCYDFNPNPSILPRSILDSLGEDKGLRGLIDKAEERHNAVKIEHDIIIADIAAEFFGNISGLQQNSLGLSMSNVMGLERVINDGNITFAVSVHTINKKRVTDLPLVVKHNGKPYVLLRDTST